MNPIFTVAGEGVDQATRLRLRDELKTAEEPLHRCFRGCVATCMNLHVGVFTCVSSARVDAYCRASWLQRRQAQANQAAPMAESTVAYVFST